MVHTRKYDVIATRHCITANTIATSSINITNDINLGDMFTLPFLLIEIVWNRNISEKNWEESGIGMSASPCCAWNKGPG